jgi:prepilin-type N-terminal cleavage/methylation domain-containing protein
MSKESDGFTLIELLMVVAIIGVMATFGTIQYVGAQRGSRDTKRMADLKQYQNALEVYSLKNKGAYPPADIDGVEATYLCDNNFLVSNYCPSDAHASLPAENYQYAPDNEVGSAGRYVMWATLEKTNDYFVVCSSGLLGLLGSLDRTANPAPFASCPL